MSSQGIQFLIENDLLKNTSDDIAQFLYKGEGLNKTAIGDYLGERCVCVCVCLAARVFVNIIFFFTSAFRIHFPDCIVSVVTHFLQVSHTLDPNILTLFMKTTLWPSYLRDPSRYIHVAHLFWISFSAVNNMVTHPIILECTVVVMEAGLRLRVFRLKRYHLLH